MSNRWSKLNRQIIECSRCPRLRAHCAEVARTKRRAYRDWDYWGKPVPNFGDSKAELLLVGLAPGAHGANRTGRMFTGDRSGDWLYRALFRAGFANQAEATSLTDRLKLSNCAITAACHCAPPANKPTVGELEHCREWLEETLRALNPRVMIALGQIAWTTLVRELKRIGWTDQKPPKFGHGMTMQVGRRWLLGSYHPSQQNTFTGRLTEEMLDAVFSRANDLLADKSSE